MHLHYELSEFEYLLLKNLESTDDILPTIHRCSESETLSCRIRRNCGSIVTAGGTQWCAFSAELEDGCSEMFLMQSRDDSETRGKPLFSVRDCSDLETFKRGVSRGNLWLEPGGRLWMFFDFGVGFFDGRGGVWSAFCDSPDDAEPVWSAPHRIWHGTVTGKPLVLRSGEWILPLSLWPRGKMSMTGRFDSLLSCGGLFRELDSFRMIRFFISGNSGKSWECRSGLRVSDGFDFDEPSLVERSDASLGVFLRSISGIEESESFDTAYSWSPPRASALRNSNTGFVVRNLPDGRFLLVKHGELQSPVVVGAPLFAYLSDDDGASWHGGLLLESENNVFSPDVFLGKDGRIFVSYACCARENVEIRFVSFSADAVAGYCSDSISRGVPVCNP